MPRVGAPSNNAATGENGQWGLPGAETELPQGQTQVQDALRRSAPMAGQPLSSGAIAAPRRSQRHAISPPAATPQPPQVAPAPVFSSEGVPELAQHDYNVRLADQLGAIASISGSSALVQQLAAQARARVTH